MTNSTNWTWEKKHLTSPVTSIEFVGSELLLSGNGPFLGVYSATKGVLLNEKCLLQRSRIHGIRVEQKNSNLVLIFGQKAIRVVKLQVEPSDSRVSTEAVSDIVTFTDLIWDAHWLYNDEIPKSVAIATAHNAVWCWDWESNVKQLVAQCEELCILYSAQFFGSNLETLIIASGTVFNQVLFWKVQGKKDENNRTSVLQRLSGHEGVIFSINFNKSGTLLSSVSDDRSIRLWKVTNLSTFELNGHVEPLLVVYGHTARVWDAKLLESCFVSIGEDLVCNVWSYDGNIVKTHRGHAGRNIWSLAINQSEDLIATGGGDGSIRLWPLSSPDRCNTSSTREASLPSSNSSTCNHTKKTKKEDYPRFVSLLDQSNLLVMTNEGCLYKYTSINSGNIAGKLQFSPSPNTDSLNVEDQWTLLLKDPEYSSYSVLALSPGHKIIAFGNLKGKIKLQDVDFNHPSVELQAYSGKVHNLLWSQQQSPQHLFSCGPDGQITWWNISFNEAEPILDVTCLCSFSLPPSKQRWASAIEIFPDPSTKHNSESFVVVCGDRKGSLHLFDPKSANGSVQELIGPAHSLPLLHGKTGVSHLCLHNNTMYSAGRDGVYRQLRIHNNTMEVIDTKKVFKGLDWVERLLFTETGDLLIAGFHSAYFVLWSVQRNELLWRVKCGGAHRVWDLVLQQSNVSISGAVLSFIKDSIIYTHKMTFSSEVRKAVLKPAFHGREATCICHIGKQGDINDIFVTGSEDTNIKLMISNRSTGACICIFTAHGHISSVRALSATKCTPTKLQTREQISTNTTSDGNCHLIFSGGGRASLKCWRVDLSLIDVDSDSCHGDKMMSSPMVFLGEYSFRFSNHRRRRKKQDLQSLSEIRFMSLTSLNATELSDSCQSLYFVMAACSDGFVRIFSFDERHNKFLLLAQSQYLKHCVHTVNHVIEFDTNSRALVMLFAGDTAGKISCWDVTNLLLNLIKEYCDLNCGEEKLKKNELEKESGYQAGVETSEVREEETANKAGERTVLESNVSLEKCDKAQESVTACYVKESVTTDNVKTVQHEDNTDDSTRTCCKGGATQDFVTVRHANDSVTNADKVEDPLAGNQNPFHCRNEVEQTSSTSETPCQSSLKDGDDQELRGQFADQIEFSCLPLAPVFLDLSTHVFEAHQSGVNAISLVKTQVSGRYLLVSGGDDSALYAAEFDMLNDDDVTKVHVIRNTSELSAHTSSVTGVKALNNGLVISSSVDQRITMWEMSREDEVSFHLRRRAVELGDVADVQDLEVWGEREDSLVAAVCGVGLQTFHLAGHS